MAISSAFTVRCRSLTCGWEWVEIRGAELISKIAAAAVSRKDTGAELARTLLAGKVISPPKSQLHLWRELEKTNRPELKEALLSCIAHAEELDLNLWSLVIQMRDRLKARGDETELSHQVAQLYVRLKKLL
jgi:hypothetical protein